MHALALAVVNDGTTYRDRIEAARHYDGQGQSHYYESLCRRESRARHYEGRRFTAVEILTAAAEVAEYMDTHVKEFEHAMQD